jgi:hypothetical protein
MPVYRLTVVETIERVIVVDAPNILRAERHAVATVEGNKPGTVLDDVVCERDIEITRWNLAEVVGR